MPSGLRGAKLLFNHRLMEGIEDAVYERAEILPENFLARSTASLRTTLGGVSAGAQLVHGEARMARSIAARRSKRSFPRA